MERLLFQTDEGIFWVGPSSCLHLPVPSGTDGMAQAQVSGVHRSQRTVADNLDVFKPLALRLRRVAIRQANTAYSTTSSAQRGEFFNNSCTI
jgi:hypothetical protein